MRVRAVLAVVALVALAGATGCHDGPQRPGPADGSSLDFTPKATLTIDDAGFHPSSLRASTGEAITVVNGGTRDHGLASDSVDTGLLRPGESTVVFLTAAGHIDGHDRADLGHTVTIDVAAAPHS